MNSRKTGDHALACFSQAKVYSPKFFVVQFGLLIKKTPERGSGDGIYVLAALAAASASLHFWQRRLLSMSSPKKRQ
ncbi:hypothetical protein COT12_00920 [Candidatus Berkelbacteria bacterium CG08_land_8_20_14_0_20_39_8]|uniref:Uncharacterized protein n=1 Tax=Candidatus Berkelbacteria bacterium CG08_land_8_20_14_0_20_39_8 TaxID=1974511 RepID=A0A2M6YCQ3_9BACT|nr:MAG: hypothetical protein COT12_00920 [Candidatus Berkelbacteria bacterium CG08_land_8_20_14_0_20_39_8]